MNEVEERVRSVRDQIDKAQQLRVRSEVERDAARARADEVREALKKEFGVTTSEQAREVEVQLEAELTQELDRVERALGGPGSD